MQIDKEFIIEKECFKNKSTKKKLIEGWMNEWWASMNDSDIWFIIRLFIHLKYKKECFVRDLLFLSFERWSVNTLLVKQFFKFESKTFYE